MTQRHDVYGVDLFEQPTQKYNYTKVSRLSPELDELFAKYVIDGVINASGSGNVPYSMAHPLLDFEANSLDTIRILDVIRKHQPDCRYLHISSAAVYGNPQGLPVAESDATHPLSPYGWHKLIAEQLCKEYCTVYGIHTAIARPFSVYGPGLKKQLFWDIYQKLIRPEDVINLYGTGHESRDYIYISDLVRAFDCVLHKSAMKGEVYNLASGVETTIQEAVNLFIKALDKPTNFTFGGEARAGDPINWQADISKVKKLGYSPSVSFVEGLHALANWIVKS